MKALERRLERLERDRGRRHLIVVDLDETEAEALARHGLTEADGVIVVDTGIPRIRTLNRVWHD